MNDVIFGCGENADVLLYTHCFFYTSNLCLIHADVFSYLLICHYLEIIEITSKYLLGTYLL